MRWEPPSLDTKSRMPYGRGAGEFALYSTSYAGGTLQMTLSAGRRPDFVAGAPSPAGGPLGVERVVVYGVPRQARRHRFRARIVRPYAESRVVGSVHSDCCEATNSEVTDVISVTLRP